ncbi:AGE family epimerase/isomerase [Alcanivorax marinus]|uniref:AGE family epimerase/isomerase n=1 Tax=Alloalcanivorax marinus TaxID=1177169 RepID=A0A9Q3YQF0_9GAMM|nr:AGE family epimerase/isomerase [Alloalcanivorax marinus]MCC4309705.1 AGE family epimerase/isomerase [Alloalcanivorax marinus]MCU5785547.1 N-acyl-D-glucosamine 2-epimerase [Alloalcanivorax marinus]
MNKPAYDTLNSRWQNLPHHHDWLEQEGRRLLSFYRAARHPEGGFGALDQNGTLPVGDAPQTMITARMTHCFALAAMRGEPGAAELAAHGVAGLLGPLRDDRYGGWCAGPPARVEDQGKQTYLHVFVALAAMTARQADVTGAARLLPEALEALERFWMESEGALRGDVGRDWASPEAYRGGNANMHAVELFVQLGDVLEAPLWRRRALAISRRLIHEHARANDYLVVEHFDEHWREWRDYHRDQPRHPFRPHGLTPGHACEWSRLLLHLEAAMTQAGEAAPDWLLEDAAGLFQAGLHYGWAVDGAPGLVYTLDWQRRPRVHERVHWAAAEACAAAAALLKRTGEPVYEQWYRRLWDYIDQYLIDRRRGSWWQELDRHNRPSGRIWQGKPDLYHAYQLTLLPRLPLAPGLARAVAEGHPLGAPC